MQLVLQQQKNTIPITIGETIFPKNKPNLNHALFIGLKILEFNIPKIRKIILTINDQYLIGSSFINGYNDTIKKNAQKTIPKLLFELILIFFIKFKLKISEVSCPLF